MSLKTVLRYWVDCDYPQCNRHSATKMTEEDAIENARLDYDYRMTQNGKWYCDNHWTIEGGATVPVKHTPEGMIV